MICPQCQSNNRAMAKFCNECGMPLPEGAPERGPDVSFDECQNDEDFTASLSEEVFGLSQSKNPTIEIPIVEVDNKETDRDFSPSQEEYYGDEELYSPLRRGGEFEADSQQSSESVSNYAPYALNGSLRYDKLTDLSGLDECLVDSGYRSPHSAWATGGTMEMPKVDGIISSRTRDYKAPGKVKKKRRTGRIFFILFLFLVILAGACASVSYYYELWGGKSLPNVVGMTQTDAVFVLEDSGFNVTVKTVISDETEGLVLLMDPSSDGRLEIGAEVIVHVASSRTVSDVVGLLDSEAALILDEDGFSNITVVTVESDEEQGTVLSISPSVGTKVKSYTEITVSIATPFTVPDVSGLSYSETIALLEQEGFEVKTSYVYNEEAAEGTVLGTSPSSGSQITSGSTVEVLVAKSRGNELLAATSSYLSGLTQITLEGVTYEVYEVNATSYLGDSTTAFTLTVAAVTTLDGEIVYGSQKEKSGVIVWSDSNEIVSIS